MSYYFNQENTRGYTDSQLREMNERFDKICEKIAENPDADFKEEKEKFLEAYDSELAGLEYYLFDNKKNMTLSFDLGFFETAKQAQNYIEKLNSDYANQWYSIESREIVEPE